MEAKTLKISENIIPSNADRRLNCQGSYEAEKHYPNTKEAYAQVGTVAHELAEKCLMSGKKAITYLGKTSSKHPNFTYNQEICRNIQKYLDYVNNIYLNCESEDSDIFVEKAVDYSEYIVNGRGKSDVIIHDPEVNTLHIIDLKYGMGRAVLAKDNSELMLYALGSLKEFSGIETIILYIAQPRLNSFSQHELTVEDLYTWLENQKLNCSTRSPSESSCEFCLAKPTCPEHLAKITQITQIDFNEEISEPDDTFLNTIPAISDKELINILKHKTMILKWLESVEELVTNRLIDGGTLEGYCLTDGRANRVWKDEKSAAIKLTGLFGDKAYSKPKLISPHQAETLLDENDYYKIKDLWEKGVSKKKLDKI